MLRIAVPKPDEYAPFYGTYVGRLPAGADVLERMRTQIAATLALLAATPESRGAHRYADGKWSVKEVVGHLSDGERVFAYRALRFGREDATDLPGFDENLYVPAGRFDRRSLADLASELAAVRAASVALFASFDDDALLRRGRANAHAMSVRALAAVIVGHELHHVGLLRERYGLTG